MFKTNKEREYSLVQSYQETRKLYILKKILIIISLFFSFSLIILWRWSVKNQDEIKDKIFGSWDIVFLDINNDELSFLENHAFIKNYSIQSINEKIFLEGDQRIVIGSSDDAFFQIGNINLINGRMPKYEKEVAVEEKYLTLLEVEQIGDVVPIDSPIKSLRGFKICGIIDNYSERWKKINWDINYINCFITKTNSTSYIVYLKISSRLSLDLEINIHNYRNNVIIHNNNIFDEAFNIYIIIILTLLIVRILIKMHLKKYNIFRISYEKPLYEGNKFKNVVLILFKFISLFLVVIMVNKLVFINNYFSVVKHYCVYLMKNLDKQVVLPINNNMENVLCFDTAHNHYDLIVKNWYQIEVVSNFISLINIILIVFIINYIISYLSDMYKNESSNTYEELYYYYFGFNRKILKNIFNYIKSFIINNFLFLIIFIFKNFDLCKNSQFIYLVLFGLGLNSCIILVVSLCKHIIKSNVRKSTMN